MRIKYVLERYVLSFLIFLSAVGVEAGSNSGQFSTLTYNVAGLPEAFSSAESDRDAATQIISCYVNAFDIVNVQEDFNYHARLYDTCNNHPFRSPTTGGMGIGSGLNTLSRLSYTDWERIKWDSCNGIDCLTPKGFTLARARLREGVYVDIYNLHAQAAVGSADLSARRDNIVQLARFIENNSVGNAVIVMGDTNTRYTRSEDNIRELTSRGFRDVWLELERGGDIPERGVGALVCEPKITSPNCEIVDKVLYRSGSFVQLQPTFYRVREDDVNEAGLKLSDHPPVEVRWQYSTANNRRFSDSFGGSSGGYFNDNALLPPAPTVKSIALRSGRRIDNIELALTNGTILSHGGSGGSRESLVLQSGEYLAALELCSAQHNDRRRIFYAKFTTNVGRALEGGGKTSTCTTFSPPDGWMITGFYGRSGAELDKLGVIYAPRAGGGV